MTRRIFFWLHLVLGVAAGTAILIMSVTGVLLAFERQALQFADRDLRTVSVPAGAAPLSLRAMLATASVSAGTAPTTVTLRADPSASAQFTIGREKTVYVDPYAGAVLGESSQAARLFFSTVERWHRTLGEPLSARGPLRAVAAASNLLFGLIVAGGLYLWWPRTWTRPALRAVTLFRPGLRARARDFNWHNVVGLWCALPLLLIALTGVVISYPWANGLLFRLAGSPVPVRQGPGGPPQGPADRRDPLRADAKRVAQGPAADIDRAAAVARGRLAGWKTMTLRVPSPGEMNVPVTLDAGAGGEVEKRMEMVVDTGSGRIVRESRFADNSLGQRLRSIVRFVHTGEEGGLAGQAVAAAASAGGVLLVWTGLSLAVRRLAGWRRSRR
jgi:uncharacterized iron-regulated membrane protein